MQLFTNNAFGHLASDLAIGATSLTLASGQGARFPVLSGGDTFRLTLIGVVDGVETSWEIVNVTARTSDTLTIVRAQEGTAAAAWPATTRVELRLTAAATESKANLGTAAYAATTAFEPADATILKSAHIGSTVQGYDSDLAAVAGLSTTGLIERTGTGTATTVTVTTAGKAILDDATTADQRTTLGLGGAAVLSVGTTTGTVAAGDHLHGSVYQPLDADLTAIAALANTDSNFIVGNGSTWVAESGATARTSLGLGTGDSPQFTAIELGAASDTTLTRSAAGKIAIEGVEVTTASNTQTLTNKTLTGAKETKTTSSSYNFNLANGNYFTHTASANNLTVSNVPATGTVASFIVELTNGGAYTFSFWSGIKWAGGSVPTLTASGVDILGFYTHDGGTTWRGLLLAKDSK